MFKIFGFVIITIGFYFFGNNIANKNDTEAKKEVHPYESVVILDDLKTLSKSNKD